MIPPYPRPTRGTAVPAIVIAIVVALMITGSTASPGALAFAADRASSAPAPSEPVPSAPTVSWRRCGALECATVRVERGASVAVARFRAGRRSKRIGVLFVNPGGPGVSAIEFLRGAGPLLARRLRQRFDIIAVDPRGVGGSRPLHCLDDRALDRTQSLDPAPDDDAEKAAIEAAARELAVACGSLGPARLREVGTVTYVRDIEAVRSALGESTVSLLGFSYGTYAFLLYSAMFGSRVRALVLDGVLDPMIGIDERNLAQARGFEAALDAYLDGCRSRRSCPFRRAANVRRSFDELLRSVDRRPLEVTSGKGSRPRSVGPAELLIAIAFHLYDESGWPALDSTMRSMTKGRGGPALRVFDAYVRRKPDGTHDEVSDANTAINCRDVGRPTPAPSIHALAADAARRYPHFGAGVAYSTFACSFWPVPAENPETLLRGKQVPALVIGNTGDPATPYEWARRVAARSKGSVLVTVARRGHTAYLRGASCAVSSVNRYLLELELPTAPPRC